MQKFVAMRNVERLTEMLAHEEDPERRATLERLLAEQKTTLEALGRQSPPLRPPQGRG